MGGHSGTVHRPRGRICAGPMKEEGRAKQARLLLPPFTYVAGGFQPLRRMRNSPYLD